MDMRDFKKSFAEEEKKRRENLPVPLLELEEQASKKYTWGFSIHYPWRHPHCHFVDTITFMGDGFPLFRLKQLNNKFTRFKMVQYKFRDSTDSKKKHSDPMTTIPLINFLKSRKVNLDNIPHETLMDFFRS